MGLILVKPKVALSCVNSGWWSNDCFLLKWREEGGGGRRFGKGLKLCLSDGQKGFLWRKNIAISKGGVKKQQQQKMNKQNIT